MFHHLLAKVALVFSLLLPPYHHQTFPERINKITASIVRITGEKDVETFFGTQHAHYICTGFFIAEHRIMTAAHCIGDNMTADGDKVTPLKVDHQTDLALLDAPFEYKPALSFQEDALSLYQEMNGVGYGYGWTRPTVTFGRIILIDYSPESDLTAGMWVSAPFIGGMSGGPIVDNHGKVIGVVQRSTDESGYGVGVTIIRAFLVGVE